VRDPATGVRGVALLHRLLCGGFAASIYDGDSVWLAEELARTRTALRTTLRA
jgi:hypothetical protein